jgi:copper transport protein
MRRPATLVLAGIGVLLWATPAGAHAQLRSADPEPGTRLDRAPTQVSLTFTEEPEPELTVVDVLDTSGATVSAGPARIAGGGRTVQVAVDDLTEGVYTVSWRVVSAVDGHTTAGAYAFGVGVDPRGAQVPRGLPQTPPPSILEMAGRWLLLAGLGLAVGAAWIGALAFAVPPRALARLALVAAVVAVAGLAALAEGQRAATEASYGAFLSSAVGRSVLFRGLAVAVMAVAAVVAAVRPRVARPFLVVAGAAALAAILIHVAAGHANATGTLRPAKVAAQWVHVGAVSVWLGGLAALLLGIRGLSGEPRAAAARRFSSVALLAFVAVAATGTIRAVNEVSAWSDLFTTPYGVLVVVKVGLLLGLLALAAVNRRRNVPQAARSARGLMLFSRAELIVAALALTAAAIMASISPRPSEAATRPPGVVVTGTNFAETVRVRLAAQPGTPGTNRFEVRLTDPADGRPLAADRVSLRFEHLGPGSLGPTGLFLASRAPGRYVAEGTNLSVAGRWEITVVVQRGIDADEIPLMLGTPCRARSLGGQPTIFTMDTPTGSVQGYVEPGTAGESEVHVTYFDRAGTEAEITGDLAVIASRGSEALELESRRLGPGHFAATATLDAGTWRFDVAEQPDGAAVCFEETIEEGGG